MEDNKKRVEKIEGVLDFCYGSLSLKHSQMNVVDQETIFKGLKKNVIKTFSKPKLIYTSKPGDVSHSEIEKLISFKGIVIISARLTNDRHISFVSTSPVFFPGEGTYFSSPDSFISGNGMNFYNKSQPEYSFWTKKNYVGLFGGFSINCSGESGIDHEIKHTDEDLYFTGSKNRTNPHSIGIYGGTYNVVYVHLGHCYGTLSDHPFGANPDKKFISKFKRLDIYTISESRYKFDKINSSPCSFIYESGRSFTFFGNEIAHWVAGYVDVVFTKGINVISIKFEKINEQENSKTHTTAIGIIQKNERLKLLGPRSTSTYDNGSFTDNKTWLGGGKNETFQCMLYDNGHLSANCGCKISKLKFPVVQTGDVVSIIVDSGKREVSFAKNKIYLGVAFTEIAAGPYIPVVYIKNSSKKDKCSVFSIVSDF